MLISELMFSEELLRKGKNMGLFEKL